MDISGKSTDNETIKWHLVYLFLSIMLPERNKDRYFYCLK